MTKQTKTEKQTEAKPCCIKAKEVERMTLETMTVFQWGSMYNAARKSCDEAQAHLIACAKPRRMALVSRIIAKSQKGAR